MSEHPLRSARRLCCDVTVSIEARSSQPTGVSSASTTIRPAARVSSNRLSAARTSASRGCAARTGRFQQRPGDRPRRDQTQPAEHVVRADQVRDKVVGGMHDDSNGVSNWTISSIAHHDDLIGQSHRFFNVVGDEHDRGAEPLVDIADFDLQLGTGDGVERSEWFVHEHHARFGGQRASQPHALLLTAGNLRWITASIRVWR